MQENTASNSSPKEAGGGTKSAKEQARIARLRNASNRMAYITNQIPYLPPPPEPKEIHPPSPSQPISSSPTHTATPSHPSSPQQKPGFFTRFTTYLLTISVALLLAGNTLGWYPRGDDQDRRALAYMYLGTLLVALAVLHRRVGITVWQLSLTVYLWVALVEGERVVLEGRKISESNVLCISVVAFLFEFLVARILSNSLLKSLLLMVSGPMVGLVVYFGRMALTTAVVIWFPSLGVFIPELPAWVTFGGGGVLAWAWLCMFVGSRIATKLL